MRLITAKRIVMLMLALLLYACVAGNSGCGDNVNSMEANVRQACRFQKLADDAKSAGDNITYNQRLTQLTAIESNYDRIKGEYEAYMNDHFRGGVIHPSQLPLSYPTLDQSMSTACASGP